MPRGVARQKPFEFFLNNQGVNQDDGILRLTPAAALNIENMHPDKTGEYTSHNGGYSEFSDEIESGATVEGLKLYRGDDGATAFLAVANGKIIEINSSTGAVTGTISTNNTSGNLVNFAPFKGSMYFAEKTMTPEFWTGSGASSPVAGFPITLGADTYDYPSLAATHANRTIYGNFHYGTLYPSHIAIFDDLDPTTITIGVNDTNGAIIQVNPGDGDYLTALKSKYVPSLGQSILICFKSSSIWALVGTTPATFEVQSINPSWGCLNSNCAVDVGQDIVFMDKNNIYSLTTAAASGTLQHQTLGSQKVQDTLKTMNLGATNKAWVVHQPFRFEVWFGIPTGASSEVDTILVYNYKHKDKNEAKWVIRTGMSATCAEVFNAGLYTGDEDGFINNWFRSSQYKVVGYGWEYHLPFYDFDARSQYKRIIECYGHFKVRRQTTFTFTYNWKIGGNNTTKTVTRTLPGSSAVYGAAVFGTDSYATQDEIRVVPIPVLGNGALFDLKVSGTNGVVGSDFLGVSGVVEYGDFIKRYN